MVCSRGPRLSAALQSLASAAAATIYDAIGVAETAAELDELAKAVWLGNLERAIGDDEAQHLAQYIERRRPLQRDPPQQVTFPGFPIPEPNLRRVGSMRHRSRFSRRREQRSPDKQASYERRHRLAYSGVLPRHLAPRLTIGEMAVMRIVGDEYIRAGGCELPLAAISARAGVCRKTAQRATRKAREERLITIEERPVRGQRHKANLIRIISFEWLKWLRRPKDRPNEANEADLLMAAADTSAPPQGPERPAPRTTKPNLRSVSGRHFVSPTDTTLTDDGDGGVVEFKKIETPPDTARPQSGQPTKEAIAFADKLATIAGHRRATTPDSWLKANPPQVVQVWLNELGKYELDLRQRPVEILRICAKHVMERKRAQDPSPPYSPRYFGPEIYKFIGGIERTRQKILAIRKRQSMQDRAVANET
jgi:hypothetical protein